MTTPTTIPPPTRMLRLRIVRELTGLGRDSIYRLARAGRFPPPRRIGDRASAWREDEIRAWIDTRPLAAEAERVAP